MARNGNLFRNLFARQQRMLSVALDTHRRRMPLRPICRRCDEIEDLLDRPVYLDAIANARHSKVPGCAPTMTPNSEIDRGGAEDAE
jgi:hypothetical protein